MIKIVKKIFGTAQSRLVGKHFRTVRRINEEELKLRKLTDDELKAKTKEFKSRLETGETTDDLLIEAYAVVKNACRRMVGKEFQVSGYTYTWDMVPYDVQLVGAIALHSGCVAEMQTGEGKTLTAVMPLYLHGLTGKPTHLVTVNDYLAKRDCEWNSIILNFLGLSCSSLTNDTPPENRKSVYEADVVYGTASEFGFDYLRDNSMVTDKGQVVQRGHYFAIVDEIDSILIDEARTPLIISGPSPVSRQMYDQLKSPVAEMVKHQRDECNRLASEAKRTLEKLGIFEETEEPVKLAKEDREKKREALKDLWLVAKGTPTNKILRRARENPDLRADLEEVETYYWGEQNKEERKEALTNLYIVVDEKSNDYELTDKGASSWKGDPSAFTMLDLGEEYAIIDADTQLSEQEKLKKKVALREEDAKRKEQSHNIRQLFRAHLLMEKDVDYIVDQGKIVIIDENTGRPQPGRRFSDGLHQAIEAKEGVTIQRETQTYATITLQNYFRLYDRLAGMTGTAITEAEELKEIYKIDVLQIPSHKKCIRVDFNDEIYMTEREKYNALIKEILQIHGSGRPILIGTESVDISEKVSRILKNSNLEHTVLNAKNHAQEAEIIARAGQKSAITVATNMAGRGTDIKLGEGVADLGGLYVIGVSRHQSRRIDRQLIGRCARQGDPGSSKFFISFEDSLMRLFASPRLTSILQKFRPPEGEPISAKMLNRSIETAQKRVEQRNYMIRKHTLQYDDVMNRHRKEVYAFRSEVLNSQNPSYLAYEMLETFCLLLSSSYLNHAEGGSWDLQAYREALLEHFPVTIDENAFNDESLSAEEIETVAAKEISKTFRKKLRNEATVIAVLQKLSGKKVDPAPVIYDVIRSIIIRSIDTHWQKHLLAIDYLRSEVSMSTIAQKDPLLEFKHEAFAEFDRFSKNVKEEICHHLFSFTMAVPEAPEIKQALSQLDILGPPPELEAALEEF